MKGDPRKLGFSTRAIHAGQHPDPTTGSVTVPIYATSTYVHEELGKHKGFEYARVQNPDPLRARGERRDARERAQRATPSPRGWRRSPRLMTLVKTGEHVVLSRNVYGGTFRFMTQVLSRYGVESSWVDTTDLANVEAALAADAPACSTSRRRPTR